MKRSVMMLSVGIAAFVLSGGISPATAGVPDPATIAAAKTPADHEAIAKAYDEEAASLEKLAARHKDLGETYGQPGGKPWQPAMSKHCSSVATELAAAAKDERALAAEHRKMAKGTEK
jgi:hypothetical protein